MRLLICGLTGLLAVGASASPESTRVNDARELVAVWTASINAGKGVEAIDRFIAPDYVWHLPGEDVRGREAVKGVFVKMLQDCPAFRLTPMEIVAERDIVVVRWSIRCTAERGDSTASISMDRIKNGQFIEGWETAVEKGWLTAAPK